MVKEKKLPLTGQSSRNKKYLNILKNLKKRMFILRLLILLMVEIHFVRGAGGNIFLENLKYVDAIEVWNGTNPHQVTIK